MLLRHGVYLTLVQIPSPPPLKYGSKKYTLLVEKDSGLIVVAKHFI